MNRAREQTGMTYQDLADNLGVSESRIYEILEGDGNVRIATVARVFAALGFSTKLRIEPLNPDAAPLYRPRLQSNHPRRSHFSTEFQINVPDTMPSSWLDMPSSWLDAPLKVHADVS